MKQELKSRNKALRARIKELEAEEANLRKKNQDIVTQGQRMNEILAQNNARILQIQGAVQELKKTIA